MFKNHFFIFIFFLAVLSVGVVSAQDSASLNIDDTYDVGVNDDLNLQINNFATKEVVLSEYCEKETSNVVSEDNSHQHTVTDTETRVYSNEVKNFDDLQNEINNLSDNGNLDLSYDYKYNGLGNFDGITISQNNVTINGNNHIIDANAGVNLVRIFKVTGNNVSLKNLVFTNANVDGDGGAIYNNGSANFKVINSTFINNTARNSGDVIFSRGGAIYNHNGKNFAVVNSTFVNNTSDDYGGAFYNGGDGCIVNNSTFVNNTSNDYAGAFFDMGDECIVNASVFINNTAKNNCGGALYNLGDKCIVNASTFINNTANSNCGGAIFNTDNKGFIVNASVFINNTAKNGCGGAVFNNGNSGDATIINSNFINNIAHCGGAIFNGHYLNISNSKFENNSAVEGDVIYNDKVIGYIGGNTYELADKDRSPIVNYGKIENGGSLVVLNNNTINVVQGQKINLTAFICVDGVLINGGNLNFVIGQNTYSATSLLNGTFVAEYSVENVGQKIVNATYDGLTQITAKTAILNINYPNLDVNDVVMSFMDGSRLSAKLTDMQANPIANAIICFNINGVTYNRTTNMGGVASIAINLGPGVYGATISYGICSKNVTVTITPSIVANNLVKMYQNDTQFYAKFLDKQGKVLVNTTVKFNINGVVYERKTNESGIAILTINLRPDEYVLTAYNPSTGEEKGFNITVKSLIGANDLTKYYRNASKFEAKIYNKDGSLAINKNITFNIHGVFYTRMSGVDGIASLNINLLPGQYIITTTYDGLSMGNNITVILNRLFGSDVESTYGNAVDFSVNYFDLDAKPISNKLVSFNIDDQILTAYTNDNGIATISLNKSAGNYIINYCVDDITANNSYVVKNMYSLTTLNWNTSGDVTKNSVIKNNLPDSELINQVVEAAKSGTPWLTFKGGEGKTVFITSGIHASELPSQIATLRLINYLENNPIDGTVHIIPFIQPIATAENVRNYNGINLNSVANIPGTISNKAVGLICALKCDAYGDFHCSQPECDPGDNVAMGTYAPLAESAAMAKYIANKTGYHTVIYPVAGQEYKGAMEDTVNLRGIPSITSEVLSPHGMVATGSIDKSFNMMKAFLEYNGII